MNTKHRSLRPRSRILSQGLLLAFATILVAGCGRDQLVEHAELRAQVESQAVLLGELREALEEVEKLEAEGKEPLSPSDPTPELPGANYRLVCEIVSAKRELFEDAILKGEVAALYELFGRVEGKQIVTGICRPSAEGLNLPSFEYRALQQKENIDDYAPIAAGEANPVIPPQSKGVGVVYLQTLRVEVRGFRDGRCLVDVSVGAGQELAPEAYPLSKIYKDREPGSIPMSREHSVSLRTEAVVALGKPTFLGTLARAPETDDGTVGLVFLTVSENKE